MNRIGIVVCSAFGLAALVGAGVYTGTRRVTLPVYDHAVTFFDENKQALLVGDPPQGLGSLSAEECGRCHRKELSQWHASAHGRSVTEPVFTAAFHSEPRFVCRSCHSPLKEQHPLLVHQIRAQPHLLLNGGMPSRFSSANLGAITEKNSHFDSGLAAEGVTCAACHVRDGTILSSRPTGSVRAPHPLSYSPQLSRSEFCAGCHQFRIDSPNSHPFERDPDAVRRQLALQAQQAAPQEAAVSQAMSQQAMVPVTIQSAPQVRSRQLLPISSVAPVVQASPDDPPVPQDPGLGSEYQSEPREQGTLDEFRISPSAARGESCQSCHMGKSGEHPAHDWRGRNDLAMLQRAIELNTRLDRASYSRHDTLQAVIKLKNDAGHRFPTGDSLHSGLVDVWLQDGDRTLDRRVWQMSSHGNRAGQFVKGVPQMAMSQIVRAAVEPSLDGPSREDTRLLPGEEATLLYRIPAKKLPAEVKHPVLRVRVYHCAVDPGFRGSEVDPKVRTMTLVREETLPVRLAAAPGVAPAKHAN